MTLVVGRTTGQRTAIVSDTQIVEHDMPLPATSGVIKTWMLPGGICASFSNSPELAARDFADFARLHPQGTSFAETIAFFERSSVKSDNEYLIAFAKHAKLVKISGGRRIRSDARTQWIGDKSAYERFREYEAQAKAFPEAGRAINAVLFADEMSKSPASGLYSTMRRVISDRAVPTVGGFVYVLSDRVEHFRQSAYCDMLFDWPRGVSENFNLRLDDQIDFGASGENSIFSISQAAPSYLGLNLAVFYLLAAKKLFVFGGTTENSLMRCQVLSDVEPLAIAHRLTEHFGYDWTWLVQVMSAAPEVCLSQFREPPIKEGPSGVRFSLLCHVNTFPKTTAA